MTDQPLVSVLTPFFNAEAMLSEAIDSVLGQTYDRWELVLVDDGSTDASAGIARAACAARPTTLRCFAHPGNANRGQAASRNLGLRHARGEYIALLDADDVWLPHKLEQQVALMEAHPEAGMLMGASLYWHGWTGRAEDAARDRLVPVGAPQDTLVRPPALLTTLYPLGRGVAPCTGSLLFRRSVLDAVGGFEDSFRGILSVYEDQALLTKLYLQTSVWISSTCSDKYRQHSASCVANTRARGNYHIVRAHFLDWFERYLKEKKEMRAEVWQAVEHASARYRYPVFWFLRTLPWKLPRVVAVGLRRALSLAHHRGGHLPPSSASVQAASVPPGPGLHSDRS